MAWRSAFLVSPAYDGVFFVAMPLIAVALGGAAFAVAGPGAPVDVAMGGTTILALAVGTLIHAHLVIVFARSHLNGAVFARTPVRFVVAPVLLLGAMLASQTVMSALLGVVIVWDAYHSSMQTFGLGRIYDARVGGHPQEGRRADLWLNHAIYLGPMLAGPLYALLVGAIATTVEPGLPSLLPILDAAIGAAGVVRIVVIAASCTAVLVYLVATVRAARRGAPISWVKQTLYASTALACVLAWGFNPLGQGLLIVNVFHAVQYFGLVAYTERATLAQRFGLRGRYVAQQVFVLLAGVGLLYGFWLGAAPHLWVPPGAGETVVLALVNTVALLHFWYDGFIWSVRRGDVATGASA